MTGEHAPPGAVPLPLPMFPLGTVLLPGMVLPLHIFEARYRVMIDDCLRHGQEFGVVLISRGSEVGGGDERVDVGTVAHITEAAQMPDGRWALLTVGTRRIRVETWLPDDPYPVALVTDLPDPDPDLDPDLDPEQPATGAVDLALEAAVRPVRRALALSAELGDPAPPATFELPPDPGEAGWLLAALAPLGPVDRQQILATAGVLERLALIRGLATEMADVLAYRIAGG